MDSIVEALSFYAEERPGHIAVIADNEQITYAELWKEVRGFAEYLRQQGFPKGSRIVVKAEPSIWFAVSCFGIHLSGNVHVPIEKTIGIEGIRSIAGQLDASLIISDMDSGTDRFPCMLSSEVRKTALSYYREDIKFDLPTSDMTCDIMFTTGTTGKSK